MKKGKMFKKILSVMLTMFLCAGCLSIGATANAKCTDPLPTNIVVGYWHNFDNGSTATKLRDVNPGWDVINVSFIEAPQDGYTAVFVPDSDVYSGTEEERIAEFKSDVKYLQSQGKHVCVSLGGQNGHIGFANDQQYETFFETSVAIIEEYGFDGFDVDLEGSSVTTGAGDTVDTCSSPIQKYITKLLHAYNDRFGDDFIISMAPEHPYVQGGAIGWGSPWGAYLPFLTNCKDVLTYIHPQYYNNGIGYDTADGWKFSGFNANSYIQLSEMLIQGFETSTGRFTGLRPDQVAIGVPCGPGAASSGVASVSEYQEALKTLLQKYPDFRGIMTWSTNWDETQGNKFVNGMRSIIDTYGDNSMGIASVKANVSDEFEVGTTVTWTAAVKNPEGSVSYSFDLYKNGTVIESSSFSSSSTFSKTITEAGEYYVVVTAKDSSTTATKTSASITAFIGELKAPVITADKSGILNIGDTVNYTAQALGGLAPYSYSFDVYNGSSLVSQGSYGSSSSFAYKIPAAGLYSVKVSVKDAQGNVKSASSASVLVSAPLSASVSAEKSGSTVTLNVSTNGGVGSNTYSYYIVKGGKVYASAAFSQNDTAAFTLTESGTYTVKAYVNDGANTRVTAETTLTV